MIHTDHQTWWFPNTFHLYHMQMKKLTLLALFMCFGFGAFAQVVIGLLVSPTITGNRFIAEDMYNFEKENNNLRLGVGVVADYFFAVLF
mgnify:CR=1 FL=1